MSDSTRAVVPVDEQRVRQIIREELAAARPPQRRGCINHAPRWACERWCGCQAR